MNMPKQYKSLSYYCYTNLNLDRLSLKILPKSLKHEEKGLQVIEQYESGFRNSATDMSTLKLKKIEDGRAFLAINNCKYCLSEIHFKPSEKRL